MIAFFQNPFNLSISPIIHDILAATFLQAIRLVIRNDETVGKYGYLPVTACISIRGGDWQVYKWLILALFKGIGILQIQWDEKI